MGDMSRILIDIPKCQEVVPGLCGSNCLVISTSFLKPDTPPSPTLTSLSAALSQNACSLRAQLHNLLHKTRLGLLTTGSRRRLDVWGASHLCLARLPVGVGG